MGSIREPSGRRTQLGHARGPPCLKEGVPDRRHDLHGHGSHAGRGGGHICEGVASIRWVLGPSKLGKVQMDGVRVPAHLPLKGRGCCA